MGWRRGTSDEDSCTVIVRVDTPSDLQQDHEQDAWAGASFAGEEEDLVLTPPLRSTLVLLQETPSTWRD